jgi:hypothetical protein
VDGPTLTNKCFIVRWTDSAGDRGEGS